VNRPNFHGEFHYSLTCTKPNMFFREIPPCSLVNHPNPTVFVSQLFSHHPHVSLWHWSSWEVLISERWRRDPLRYLQRVAQFLGLQVASSDPI
jgi:hypothetical protein